MLLVLSVPLITYAVIARVPINTMFLAGLVPAVVMVACLLIGGGFLRRGETATATSDQSAHQVADRSLSSVTPAAWAAKSEMLAPVVAIGSLISGLATPTESAAITAGYASLTQALA